MMATNYEVLKKKKKERMTCFEVSKTTEIAVVFKQSVVAVLLREI